MNAEREKLIVLEFHWTIVDTGMSYRAATNRFCHWEVCFILVVPERGWKIVWTVCSLCWRCFYGSIGHRSELRKDMSTLHGARVLLVPVKHYACPILFSQNIIIINILEFMLIWMQSYRNTKAFNYLITLILSYSLILRIIMYNLVTFV